VNAEMEVLVREALARRGIKLAKPAKDDSPSDD
jgi:hypothetical protein